MPSLELILILAVGVLIWMWFDILQAREAAIRQVKTTCALEQLMLLDDTVAVKSMRLARDDEGRLKLQRSYDFEYTDTGNNRCKGSVVLLGHRVIMLNVGTRDEREVRTLH